VLSNIKRWGVLIICVSFLGMSACTQVPVKQTQKEKPAALVKDRQNAWKQRQAYLNRKTVWSMTSKIALRFRDDHWTFGLNWLQRSPYQYVMQIKNPVTGAIVAKISRQGRQVTLLANDGKRYQDTDEERLLQRQTDVILPLKGMQYWVRGLISPQYKVDKLLLDARGRPTTIYQAGWKINYSRYANQQFNALPGKIVITRDRDSVYLKIIVKQWR